METTEEAYYLRPRGDKATAVSFVRARDTEGPPDAGVLEHLKHGDLAYEADGYRGTDTWVVIQDGEGNRRFEGVTDGAGYSEIEVEVSELIEDPLDFYAEVTDDNLYQGVTTINLDPTAHQDLLRAKTGGRPVDESRCLWWTTYNGCIEVAIPRSHDHPRGGSAELCATTPIEYLTDVDWLDEDPVTLKERAENRVLFEEKAPKIFEKMEEGTYLSLSNFPTTVDGGSSGAGGSFVSFEDGAVHVKMTPEGVVVFRPRLVAMEVGPYAGVKVWATDNISGGMPRTWMISGYSLEKAGDE